MPAWGSKPDDWSRRKKTDDLKIIEWIVTYNPSNTDRLTGDDKAWSHGNLVDNLEAFMFSTVNY